MKILMTIYILSFCGIITAQSDLGLELQVYPTGIIPGIRFDQFINDKSTINLRVALQFIDHRDLGVQDDETGNGYGFSVGYQRYFSPTKQAWHINLRSDYWRNTIDWENLDQSAGTTEITVLQPTAALGYTWLTSSQLVITPSMAFGWEWNVSTNGSPTGEGAILLIGIQLGKRF